mmetsp:Transcript_54033/g.164183  ORF Transcript_54033/g.164183 Transcript_54033/m.164183 type:complete len:214 (+) Transcript_54033:2557-3198(+)
MAGKRRGCATTIVFSKPSAASNMNCGTCVVFPQPVEPWMMQTRLWATLATISSLCAAAGKDEVSLWTRSSANPCGTSFFGGGHGLLPQPGADHFSGCTLASAAGSSGSSPPCSRSPPSNNTAPGATSTEGTSMPLSVKYWRIHFFIPSGNATLKAPDCPYLLSCTASIDLSFQALRLYFGMTPILKSFRHVWRASSFCAVFLLEAMIVSCIVR